MTPRVANVSYRDQRGPLRIELAAGIGGWIGLIFDDRRLAYAVQRETWETVDALLARRFVELLTVTPSGGSAAP